MAESRLRFFVPDQICAQFEIMTDDPAVLRTELGIALRTSATTWLERPYPWTVEQRAQIQERYPDLNGPVRPQDILAGMPADELFKEVDSLYLFTASERPWAFATISVNPDLHQLLGLGHLIYGLNTFLPPEAPAMLNLRVLPNWYAGTAGDPLAHNSTVGGPGGLPVPASPATPKTWSWPHSSFQPGQNRVDVVILDTGGTVPDPPEESGKATETVATAQQNPTLNRVNSVLEHPTGPAVPDHLDDMRVAHHHYAMNDHAMFIAGIINAIAPQARLRMIPVLDRYGVGTIDTLVKGFKEIDSLYFDPAAESDAQAVIINCSLTFAIPQSDNHAEIEALMKSHVIMLDRRELGRLIHPASDLQEKIAAQLQPRDTKGSEDIIGAKGPEFIIVAAAGNDSAASGPLEARWPAALDGVVGVAAWQYKGEPVMGTTLSLSEIKRASYSNIADRPYATVQPTPATSQSPEGRSADEKGFIAFGGAVETVVLDNADIMHQHNAALWNSLASAIPGKSILGLYLEHFPSPDPCGQGQSQGPLSSTGYAWWAGTSFATAVVSGALARLATDMDIPAALAALKQEGKYEEQWFVSIRQQ
jgi:hypothetical protein